ncbi:hypothetical protein [Bacteriophage sp.]|nr:hypothetical protein [Bacteriophage sp.]
MDPTTELEGLRRHRQLLDAMMQQSMQQPIVGNTGLGQALAKLATGFIQGQQSRELDQQMSGARQRYGEGLQQEAGDYLNRFNGTPGDNIKTFGADPGQDAQITQNIPEVAPNPQEAVVRAMASQYPEMQNMGRAGMQGLMKQAQSPLEIIEKFKDIASPQSLVEALNNRDPRLLKPKLTTGSAGDQIFDLYNPGKPIVDGRMTYKRPELRAGSDGRMDLYQEEDRPGGKVTKLDNSPKVQVSSNPIIQGENAGIKAWATKAMDVVDELHQQARGSVKLLGTLNQLEKNDKDGTFMGPAANAATFLGSLAQSMGLPVDREKLANSQTFDAASISAWQDMIKAAGGNRGVVKEEAARIAQMVPQLSQTPEGRKQITAFLRQAAEQSVQDAKDSATQYSDAIMSGDLRKFTFGLGASMLPRTQALPAAPGASSGNGKDRKIKFEDM